MWMRRNWQLGLGLGLGLGGLGLVAVSVLGRSGFEAPLTERVGGWLYTSALLGAGGALLGLVTTPLIGRAGARRAVATACATFWSAVALVLVASVVFRIASGTFLTAGVLMFTMNGSDAIAHAASGEYLRTAIAAALALSSGIWGARRLLVPAALAASPPRRRDAVLALLVSVLVALPYARRQDSRYLRGMLVSAPLLALASSFEVELEVSGEPTPAALPKAPPGPGRDAEEGFREAIERARVRSCDGVPCPRPNVLLVVLESLAPRHLGASGYARKTPALDRLFAEGLVMTRAWATATHSNYAQPAILSSLFPRRGNGLDQYEELDYPRFLFHDFFHALGYETATVSSQDEDWQGMRRFQDTGTPTFYWYADDFKGEALDSGVERTAPDEATTDQALAWLARPRKAPFALYLNLQGTHFPYTLSRDVPRPYQPDEPDRSNYSYLRYAESDRDVVVNRYDNALLHVDRQLARLREALEAANALEDTLIVVTADHGELFFDREMVTHGRTLYDVEARVPLVLRWPRKLAALRRGEPVSHLDLLPTIAALLELPPHPSWQGRSFVRPQVDAEAHAIFLNIQGLRFADAVVCWPWKLMHDRTARQRHLYHLGDDPEELSDRFESEPELARALSDTLDQQLLAQLEYHDDDAHALRGERFAPRLRRCPAIPRSSK
jgi:arylsulfatase A-like enzyme